MNLPPLPDTSWVDIPHFTYTSKDMLAYGKACAAAALVDETCEALAQPIDDGMCPNCVTPWKCNGPHIAPDSAAALAQRADEPEHDPMNTPLPCDVKVGNGTHRKGTPLRTLVARMKMLHEAAFGPELSPAEKAANLATLQGCAQRADEPVAWRWSESNGERWFDWTTDWDMHRRALATKGCLIQYAYSAAAPAAPAYVPLSEFERMQAIGDEFPIALVQPIIIQKVDSVCRAIEALVVARMRDLRVTK